MVRCWYWCLLHLDYYRFDKYIARCFHFHRYRMPTAGKKETDTIISLSLSMYSIGWDGIDKTIVRYYLYLNTYIYTLCNLFVHTGFKCTEANLAIENHSV